MRALLLSAVVLLGLCACGGGSRDEPASVRHHGIHERIPVTFTARAATGVQGRTIRHYTAQAHAVRAAGGCVNSRDGRFPASAAGQLVKAALDPLRGEGGPEGWCRGRYRGTVTYFEGFACPARGACHAPPGFPTRTKVVARFAFVVD
jgi:hypothetical protein